LEIDCVLCADINETKEIIDHLKILPLAIQVHKIGSIALDKICIGNGPASCERSTGDMIA
jgi:hypothetical protein